MEDAATGHEAFTHVRILVGMVLGLSVTRLLSGLARFVAHPGRVEPYWVHLGWVVLMLLAIVHFWWFEFGLTAVPVWTFRRYVFILGFAALHFFTAAVLFPTASRSMTATAPISSRGGSGSSSWSRGSSPSIPSIRC